MERKLRKRNGFITFCLWIAIIVNILLAIDCVILAMFDSDTYERLLGNGICSILCTVNVLSAILLMRWNKTGFYLFVVSTLLIIFVFFFVFKSSILFIQILLAIVVISWAILQLKKDGVSAWSQLQSGWNSKHCRYLYLIFSLIGIVLFVLTIVVPGLDIDGSSHSVFAVQEDIIKIDDPTTTIPSNDKKHKEKSCKNDYEMEIPSEPIPDVTSSMTMTEEKGQELCSVCGGSGKTVCGFCKGQGHWSYLHYSPYPPFSYFEDDVCYHCNQSGKLDCLLCKGSGKKLEIPQGNNSGGYHGEGNYGGNYNNSSSSSHSDVYTKCTYCHGTGTCQRCHGAKGEWTDTGYYTGSDNKTWINCSSCGGSGSCSICYGRGKL